MEQKIIYRLVGTLTLDEGQPVPDPNGIDKKTLCAPRRYQQLNRLPTWAKANGNGTIFVVTETPTLFDNHAQTRVKVYEAVVPKPHAEDIRRLKIIAKMLCDGESLSSAQRRHNLGHSTISAWLEDFGLDTDAPRRLAQEKADARKTAGLQQKVASLKQENAALKARLKHIKEIASE